MITDEDVGKLQKVFTTKGDLVAMEARQDKKYASKADLEQFKEDILESVDGKLAAQKGGIMTEFDAKLAVQKDEIVTEVGEYIADTIVPVIEQRDIRLDRLEKALNLAPTQ